MAQVKYITGISATGNICDFFNSIDSSILSVDFSSNVLTLTIDGKATIALNLSDPMYISISGTYFGTSYSFPSGASPRRYEGLAFYVVASENMFMMKLVSLAGWSGNTGCAFVYVKSSDDDYFGSIQNNNNVDVSNISMANGNGGSYSIKNILSYSMDNGYIDYIKKGYLFSGNTKLDDIDGILSCSTIPNNSTITIDGENYYAMGSNLLVGIDGEI